MKGIDVSSYQSVINWAEVKASGVEFVIIRAGWGKTNIDASFKKHIEGALNAGLKVGVYWFIYAKSEADVKKNASKCDAVIKDYKDRITERVWADFEYDSDKYFPGLDKATRTRWVELFCEEMQDKGYSVGVYANKDYLKNYFNDLSKYPLWFAYYARVKGDQVCEIWQSSSAGSVPGISGNVDLDEKYEATASEPVKTEPAKAEEEPQTDLVHIVKAGDTLGGIAKKYGTTYQALAEYNGIKNPNIISVGQVIKIPKNAPASDAKKYKVNAYVLNVRAGATIRARIVGTLKRGEIIEIEEINGIWGKLRAQNKWVCTNYIKRL